MANEQAVQRQEDARRRSDGERTHAAILDAAMRLASIEGIHGLTIGRLASDLGISRSGVFAHFRSRQRLQQETLIAARQVIAREVVQPAMSVPPGLTRVRTLVDSFFSYVERGVFPGGCIFASMLADVDARPGLIKEEVAQDFREWRAMIVECLEQAQATGELDGTADVAQLAFEIDAVLEYSNYMFMLLGDPAQLRRGAAAVDRVLSTRGEQ